MTMEFLASEKASNGYMFVYFMDRKNGIIIKKIFPVYEGGGKL